LEPVVGKGIVDNEIYSQQRIKKKEPPKRLPIDQKVEGADAPTYSSTEAAGFR
jgi:hypothetical protein